MSRRNSKARYTNKTPSVVQEKSRDMSVEEEIRNYQELPDLPISYQDLNDFASKLGTINPYLLRRETYQRIEKLTGRNLICYVSKTEHVHSQASTSIDHSDLIGFDDLVHSTPGEDVDVFIISNGGSAEATERIVNLLRANYKHIRFIVPANSYSAATLLCMSGDEILMTMTGTLGPIDPQIGGIPSQAIIKGFEAVKERLLKEGPESLTAYVPMLKKYDLHLFEMCRSAEELSKDLARKWLQEYMLKDEDQTKINAIVDSFSSYDLNKSHSRSIEREQAREMGLKITNTEENPDLDQLIRSLRNQFAFVFDKQPFVKLYENARGINWGRNEVVVGFQPPQQK